MMKNIALTSFPVAALSMAFVASGLVLGQPAMAQSADSTSNMTSNMAGSSEAAQMVAARAYLTHKLDAKDAKPGTQFTANLSKTIHLKNGTELPHGTKLIGTVATDDMNMQGTSKLALRITKAQLENGTTIPVKVTIVGVYAPESETAQGYPIAPGDEQSNDWSKNVLTIDQLDAMSGVDLHSRIAGRNSGVFVAKKKDDVKISAGSELALAIGAAGNNRQGSAASNGGM
jgi:hypothetical protein